MKRASTVSCCCVVALCRSHHPSVAFVTALRSTAFLVWLRLLSNGSGM